MLTPNFLPFKCSGHKFDRGMQLLEFTSQRSAPDADIETYTGDYKDCGRFVAHIERFVRSHIECVPIPQPKMLLGGNVLPDGFITNAHEVPDDAKDRFARKVTGMGYGDIAPGYYRAAWLPPPVFHATLKEATFHYPAQGYAGVLARSVAMACGSARYAERSVHDKQTSYCDSVELCIAFLIGYPQIQESVLFVADESPVYRVTNQDACIGRRFCQSRLVVEYRGDCDVRAELARLHICYSAELCGFTTMRLTLPNADNLRRNPKLFTNSLNDQLIRIIRDAKTQP